MIVDFMTQIHSKYKKHAIWPICSQNSIKICNQNAIWVYDHINLWAVERSLAFFLTTYNKKNSLLLLLFIYSSMRCVFIHHSYTHKHIYCCCFIIHTHTQIHTLIYSVLNIKTHTCMQDLPKINDIFQHIKHITFIHTHTHIQTHNNNNSYVCCCFVIKFNTPHPTQRHKYVLHSSNPIIKHTFSFIFKIITLLNLDSKQQQV